MPTSEYSSKYFAHSVDLEEGCHAENQQTPLSVHFFLPPPNPFLRSLLLSLEKVIMAKPIRSSMEETFYFVS